MLSQAGREYVALTAIGLLFLVFFIPAVLSARTQVRDNLRKQDLTNLKHALEMYNNDHRVYVTPPTNQPTCTHTAENNSWFFGSKSPLLEERYIDAIPHDVREAQGHTYRYCVTTLQDGQAAGYYLEAKLEGTPEEVIGFDEDESRKFHYRIVHDDGHFYYRVCGGIEQQCQNE